MRRVTVNLKIPKSLNKSFEIILLIYNLLNHPLMPTLGYGYISTNNKYPRFIPDYNELYKCNVKQHEH